MRWLVLGGTRVGFAFLTKMMQSFLVLPPLGAGRSPRRQARGRPAPRHLLTAFGSILAALAGGSPSSSSARVESSVIGGSQNNSILEWPRLQRLRPAQRQRDRFGRGGSRRRWRQLGRHRRCRLFNSEIGGQIAWLLPAALALLALGLWFRGSAGRTDRQLGGLVVWGGWLLVTGLTFSLMAGIFHAYYTVALAPAIAAVVCDRRERAVGAPASPTSPPSAVRSSSP